MRRRAFLGALSAATLPAVAGCSTLDNDPALTVTPASVPDDSSDSNFPLSRQPVSLPDEPFARSSRVMFNTVGLRASLFPMRSRTPHGLVDAWFLTHDTGESAARVAVRFVNPTTTTRRYVLRRPAPLGTAFLHGDVDLVLVPTAAHPDVEDAPPIERGRDGCWRLAGPLDPSETTDEFTLPPSSSVGGEFALVAEAGSDCPGTGTSTVAGDLKFSVALWNPDRPGPTRHSRFLGVTVPPLPLPTAFDWFHEADRTTALYLEPSAERVDLPGTVSFTLVNRSRLPLSGNPSAWALWKLTDRQWRRVATSSSPDRVRWVPIGARERWSVRLRDDAPNESADIDVGHLEGGRYAFTVPYGRGSGRTAALFDVDVPALTVSPEFRSGHEGR